MVLKPYLVCSWCDNILYMQANFMTEAKYNSELAFKYQIPTINVIIYLT